MKLILTGFMASGKTSVAQALGKLLKLPVMEMDELVFQKTNAKDMHQIFSRGGELLLRETEIAIAKENATANNMVISTGGGVGINKIVLDYLKGQNGRVFFLHTSFQVLIERLADDKSRPLFQNPLQARSLYDFRLPLYLKLADEVIEVLNQSIEEIAQEIIDKMASLMPN